MAACVAQQCEEDRDCEDSDEVCDDHRCVEGEGEGEGDAAAPPEAAPPPDRGVDDAGVADTGAADGGPDLDVSIADAAIPDAGMADAAPADARVADAAPSPEAGVVDPLALIPVGPNVECTVQAFDDFTDGAPTTNGGTGRPNLVGMAAQLTERDGNLTLAPTNQGGGHGLRWATPVMGLGANIAVRLDTVALSNLATTLEFGFTFAPNGFLRGYEGLWAAAVLTPAGDGRFTIRIDQYGEAGEVIVGEPAERMLDPAATPLPLDLIFEVRPDMLEVRLHAPNETHDEQLLHNAVTQLGFEAPMPPGGGGEPPPDAYPVVQVAGASGQGNAVIAWMVAAHCMPPAIVP